MKNLFSIRSGMGIQKRLLLLLLVVLVPLLLVQGFTYYEWFQERKEAEMRANLELARTVAKTFDAFVKEVLQTELAIGMAATASPALLHDDLRNILFQATKANRALRNFSWVSPEGRVLACANPEFENVDISKTDHYAKIRSGREWVVGDLIASQVTGKPVFTISRGIRDSKGNLLGIVAAVVLPDGLNEVLDVERSKDAGVSLVDSKGIHVYRYPPMGYTSEQTNWFKHYVLKGKEIATTVVSQVTGKKRLVGFAPVSSMGWVAAASRAEDDVREAITSVLFFKAILFLLVALAAFGAALALFRPIPISIGRLRDHALALGRGEIKKLDVVSGPSELKDLAISINQMAEKVRLEAALRESEQRWATTLASIGDAVIASDTAGSITFMNAIAEALTGWKLGEVLEKPVKEVFNIINEHTRQRVEDPITKVLKAGMIVGLANQTLLVRKDGTEVAIDDSGAPIKDLNGKTMGVVLVFRDITERKRAEQALRSAHQRAAWLARFPEENPSPVARVSGEGSLLYCNPAVANLPGWECEVGKPLPHRLMRLVEQAIADDHEVEQDVELGGRFYSVWISPFPGERYVNVYGRDITARKRAEDALRESEERFRIAEKVGKMGHFAWNVVKGSITGSPYLEIIHGLEPGTFKGGFENWLAMVHPDDKTMITEFIQQAFNKKLKEAAFDIRILRPNGEPRWVSAGVTVSYDPSGCPFRALGTMTDITDRKRMEERLRQSEKRSKLLIKYAPSMICEIDFHGPRFKSVNDAMCDYLGYPRKELLAMNPFDLLDDEGKTVFRDRFNKILNGEVIRGPVEYKSKSKDGRELYTILNMTFTYKDGKPEGAVIVAHDVTERKRVEEERERLIHNLQDALANIRRLHGLLPICASCKKIRDDEGYWNQLEIYIQEHSEAEFTHGICPDCMEKLYGISLGKEGNFKKN